MVVKFPYGEQTARKGFSGEQYCQKRVLRRPITQFSLSRCLNKNLTKLTPSVSISDISELVFTFQIILLTFVFASPVTRKISLPPIFRGSWRHRISCFYKYFTLSFYNNSTSNEYSLRPLEILSM